MVFRKESVESLLSRPKINADELFDADLHTARKRAERAINDDAFFDSRGTRIPKASVFDEDIDEEVSNSKLDPNYVYS